MATYEYNLILVLACVSTLMYGITCKPVKRSATDCYGTDSIIPQDELDFHGNPRNTELLENITGSMVHAFPEITDILKNIAYYTHQNATVTTLSSILQTLEDEKGLQVTANLLIENVTAVFTPMLSEMVKVMQNQQAMQERHNQLMEDQADTQSRLLENVTALLQQSFLPLVSNILQFQQDSQQHSCLSGLSGQLTISPKNTALGSFPVACDMDTDGGGWIVFQRRFDGSTDFDRVWNDYENGFGSLSGEFWLGLNKLHVITSRGQWELRVDPDDFDGNKAYAIHDNFSIGDSASFYRLDIGSYSGTAGDGMTYSAGLAFTTKDEDHDQHRGVNCAIRHQGAWWHDNCSRVNLNGQYLGRTSFGMTGMNWFYWKRNYQSLKKSELKIRLTDSG